MPDTARDIPACHGYRLTAEGLRIAYFVTRVHFRLLRRGRFLAPTSHTSHSGECVIN